MSYSKALQWSRHSFKSRKIVAVFHYSSSTDFKPPSKNRNGHLPGHQESGPKHFNQPQREPYSFIFARRPFVLKARALWRLYNSNSNSTLRGIENEPLTKVQASDLILKLTENERRNLFSALQEFSSNQIKAEYQGQLAATRWRSKFGRPSKLPTLGDVDPTGSYCHLPEDWLKKKYAEQVPQPTGRHLIHIGIFNAVPFIGFGFLDNFIMICAGDCIEDTLGSLITMSTMTAAALGNTVSDVMGIGSAWYVELAASKVGLKAPNLSPIQLDMKASRRAANLGRAVGITIGCLLGMLPLIFKDTSRPTEGKKTK